MASTSIAAAKADLFALVDGKASLSGIVTSFYDHEPAAGNQLKGCALTVSTAGMTAEFYVLALRLYQSLDVGAKQAQDDLDAAIMAVDAVIDSSAEFGPSNWTVDIREELGALVAENLLQSGRQD